MSSAPLTDDIFSIAMRENGYTEADIRIVLVHAHNIHRAYLGKQFHRVLEEYYARRKRGERPKLRAMAIEFAVNYASLRQFKIRYDQTRDKALQSL